MPKVILACSGVGHVLRGYERATFELARRLRGRLDVTLARGGGAWRDDDGVRLPCVQRGGSVLRALRRDPAASYALEQRTFAAGLYALARQRGADVIHVHDPAVMNALWHARRAFGGSFRILFTNGGLLDPEHLWRPDSVHVTSPVDEARLLTAGHQRERVWCIPYGIDLSAATAEVARGEELRLIGIGALTAEKGADVAIRAAARAPSTTLTLLGQRYPDTEDIEILARGLLGDRARLGTVAPDDVEAELLHANAFILPTRSEGFGMAVLEAMAAGLPCVVSDIPVLRWLVGDAGILVPPADVDAWVEALRSLTAERRVDLANRARERARQMSWQVLVEDYVRMYEHTAASGAGMGSGGKSMKVKQEGQKHPVPSRPAVSVVVPTYSRPDLLIPCVESVLAQETDFEFEVLVIDDGGTPTAEEALRDIDDGRLRVVRQRNGGPASARNRGIHEARADIVALMDDDCTATPGWLKAGHAAFTSSSVMVQGPVAPPRKSSPLIHHYMDAQWGRHDLTCNMFLRRAVALAAGGFDEKFPDPAGEDYDFCLRMERAGEVVFAPGARVVHALLPVTWKKRRARPRLWRSHFRYYALHPEKIHRASLPIIDKLVGPALERRPLVRIGTYLAGEQFVVLLKIGMRLGWRGAPTDFAACVLNVFDGLRMAGEYVRAYEGGLADARRRESEDKVPQSEPRAMGA